MKYVDRFGREKQLLQDIKNWNDFTVSLVGRNLQSELSIVGTHSFIIISSKNSKWIERTYTIWGQDEGNLVWKFNHPDDRIEWNWALWAWSVKSQIGIATPAWMTDSEFVQNIYNEYVDYNQNNQVEFNVFSKPFWWNDSWNCSNFATTILIWASNNDPNIQLQLSNYDNLWFDWWIGEVLY